MLRYLTNFVRFFFFIISGEPTFTLARSTFIISSNGKKIYEEFKFEHFGAPIHRSIDHIDARKCHAWKYEYLSVSLLGKMSAKRKKKSNIFLQLILIFRGVCLYTVWCDMGSSSRWKKEKKKKKCMKSMRRKFSRRRTYYTNNKCQWSKEQRDENKNSNSMPAAAA